MRKSGYASISNRRRSGKNTNDAGVVDIPDTFQDIPCPLCGTLDYSLRYDTPDRISFHLERAQNQPRENVFQIVACSSCGFLYLNPRPDQSHLQNYYRADSYDPHRRRGGGLAGALFRFTRQFTIRWKAAKVSKDLTPSSVLDVGCGTGEFMVEMTRRGWQVVGIEISTEAATTAKEMGLNVKLGNPAEVDLQQNAFDLVTLWHSLEHLPDLKGAVNRVSNALKPGGRLAIAVPNPDSVDARFYGLRWAAWDAPRHLYHFRPKDLVALFKPKGIRMQRKTALPLDPFYHALLSELSWSSGLTAGIKVPRSLLVGGVSFLAGLKPDYASSILYIFSKD